MSTTTSAAIKAGLRTAEQALSMGLGVLTAGGAIAGATDFATINWKLLAGALAFIILVAFFAGLKSFLSFIVNGVPAAYTAPPVTVSTLEPSAVVDAAPVDSTVTATPETSTTDADIPAAVGV